MYDSANEQGEDSMSMLPNTYTRDEFVSIINRIIETRDFTRMTDRALIDARADGIPTAPDFFSMSAITSGWEQELVDTMSRMFMDEGEGGLDGTLSWWLYELDYGRDWKPGAMSYHGEDVDLHDAGALYDFLVRQMEDKLERMAGEDIVDTVAGAAVGASSGSDADVPDFPDYADGGDEADSSKEEPTGNGDDGRDVDWERLVRMANAGREARPTQPTFVPDGVGSWKVNPDIPDDRLIPTFNGWMRKGDVNLDARAITTDGTDGVMKKNDKIR